MDEDISVKAPVTRLRRRMSVEGDDSPLPTTPSTPTKKRAARLAAKPQLELIDEVATENVPKRSTRKAAVKENIEADTNIGTPTPVTPSRRSTRIRSNTSILSETATQNIESPRAKRALRRNSQLGSDTESSALTPARSTRRTRKDSTTNIDKQAGDEGMVVSSTNTEDTEKDSKESKTNEADNVSPSTRKSPRLQNKKGGKTEKPDNEVNKSLNKSTNNNKSPQGASPSKSSHVEVNGIDATSIDTEKDKLSTSNVALVNENKTNINKHNDLNKSTSAIDKIANDLMHKRSRTKSWTTLTNVVNNEESKPDVKGNTANTSITGSGDGLPTSDENQNISKTEVEYNLTSPNKSINAIKPLSNKDDVDSLEILDFKKTESDTAELFEKSPYNQKRMVLIEDSDSCSGKLSMDIQMDGEDQCVPVVVNPTKESPKKCEQEVEPMDIDESMPVNVTIEDYSDKSNNSKDDIEVSDKRKSLVSENSLIINKSKRKSSIRSETANLEENNIDYMNKSNRNSISSKTNTSISEQETKNKSLKETSLVIDESKETSNKSLRKSSISVENDEKLNDSSNKSKRKSSVSLNDSVNINESTKSQGNTPISVGSQFLVDDQTVEQKVNEIANKSKRQSVSLNHSEVNQSKNSLDKSQRKTSISIDDNVGKLDVSSKNSKRKSSISCAVNQNESKEDSSKRKSSMSISEDNADKLDGSSNKSKRKSSISHNSVVNQKSIINETNDSSNKQNKNSSISQSDNENKSTLVISQLKDVSTNDTNNAMSPNVTNNELSKSMNDPDVKNKAIDKKNLNYLTSTPIQQKSLQKLAMQINTSIISPGVENKNNTSGNTAKKNTPKKTVDSDFSEKSDEEIKFKITKEKSKNSITPMKKYARAPSSSESSDEEADSETKTSIKKVIKKSPNKKQIDSSSSDDDESDSESRKNTKKTPNNKQNQSMSNSMKTKTPNKRPPSDSSDSEESEQEAPKDKSKMVDDEASDAGEDYESGDSQNEEDRKYEAENEIVEKGETLDSEEEFSNDSDYEKDSFLVSSDAEDNEMLSGTGDDLSMSDNELTMSAKSKSKFNERKLKQQKKASKEMYEARHKLDESANSTKSETKSKKSKRQRLESSTLESDNENVQSKKNNRRRIDSSQDYGIIKSDADEFIGIKKKKSKRLSESVHDITTNEKEITLNQSSTERNDPLSVAIKQEPKTPLRNFDMSTVAINDKIEEVEVDENATIMKQNESLDPLQATMHADDDDSSSSDNMEIMQNYDSVLNNLSMQTKKIKTADTSLNLNKKSKDSKNPVIDQLNLTQVKQNKNKKSVEEKKPESVPQATKKSKVNDEDSSDSIDMKLLFPEDSNDSEINASQFKSKTTVEPEEYFIPLKRTEAQTNIPKKIDTSVSELNVSKKKRKSSISVPEEATNNDEESEDSNIKMFIDTTGTHQEVELETSIVQTNSSKKKNKKSLNMSTAIENAAEVDCTDGATETAVEVSFTSEKKKKKNKNKSFDVSIFKIETSFTTTEILSEQKRKSGSTSLAETHNENTENTIIQETPVNVSIKSEKKKYKNKNVSQIIELADATNSAKKKAKDTSISVEPETEIAEVPAETSMNSEKKKKKKNKKKNKQNLENSQVNVDNAGEESDDAPMEMSYKSEKKTDAIDTVIDEAASSTEKKKHKKNKKKKNKNLSQSIEKPDDTGNNEEDSSEPTKRKRKSSGNSITEVEPISVTTSNEKKKRKIHLDDECLAVYDDTELNNEEGSSKKSKKNKKNKNLDNIIQDELPTETKKRKNRDDDGDEKIHKVSKQNSFDKIHVPKIPESVVKQLSENPNIVSGKQNVPKMKKKKTNTVIATMPFVVEQADRRKNKPSNYLEQSIYLNDSPVKTKQNRFKDKPKVLPFTPTALTSDSGFTSKFNINVLPGQTQFVAQASNVDNFRETFLGNQRIKKMGTLERFKLHRSHKISKF